MHEATLVAINKLRLLAKKNGFVLHSEISSFLPANILSSIQISAIIKILNQLNIKVIKEKSTELKSKNIKTKQSKINLNEISLKSFVENNNVPERIKNAIISDSDFIDFGTLNDFLNNNDGYQLLLRVPNLGKESINQLIDIVNNFIESDEAIKAKSDAIFDPISENITKKLTNKDLIKSLTKTQQKALKNISIAFFANNSNDLDVRTRNCLLESEINKKLEIYFENLYDLYVAPLKVKNLLLNLPNFGQNSKIILDQALINLVKDEDTLLSFEKLCNQKPEQIESYNSIAELLHSEISLLNDERIVEIINPRFLLKKKLTLEELGVKFEVTRERVRQIESQGLKKIFSSLKIKFTEAQITTWSTKKLKDFFFLKNSFISLKSAQKLLKEENEPTYHNLFIKIYSKNLQQFLSIFFTYNKKYNGWFLSNEVDQNYSNIESRITLENGLLKERWPIKLQSLATNMRLPEAVALDLVYLTKNLEIYELHNEKYIRYKKIKTSDAVRLALGSFKQGANFIELKDFIYEVFNLTVSIRSVSAHLDYFPDAIMIERAQYSKYILIDNLNLSQEELEFFKQYAITFLLKKQEFISAGIIFKNLLKCNNSLISNSLFSSYTLYEICKVDSRFLSGRGSMLGLTDDQFKGEFISLAKEYINLMKKFSRPIKVSEIIYELASKRQLLEASVFNQLNNDSNGLFVRIGDGFYLSDDINNNQNNDELWETDFDDI
jgi:hypothetical protein